jgi:uncharacterized membrane protein YidH (DUF202 family)
MSEMTYILSVIFDQGQRVMSFREKIAWISLIAQAVVFGAYFILLCQAWDDSPEQGLSIGLMVAAAAALVVIVTVPTIVIAVAAPKQANAAADERERIIALKSESVASYVLSTGVVCLVGALLAGWNAFLVANLLLGSLVIAELVKAGAQILSFRVGA